jgi:molybdopterin-guanine dinucleotide biosynthesis protein A
LLRDYRDWLESELKLLGNASHHAYAFGQANMAKRALERFETEWTGKVFVALDDAAARRALTAIEVLGEQPGDAETPLEELREALRAAIAERAL